MDAAARLSLSEYRPDITELLGDLTRRELVEALSLLRFDRREHLTHMLRVDADTRDFLVRALQARPHVRTVVVCAPPPSKPSVDPERIIEAVAHHFRIGRRRLLGSGRTRSVVLPRAIAQALVCHLTELSLMQVGQLFHRDHTSILHSRDKLASILASIDLSRDAPVEDWVVAMAAGFEAQYR